MSGTVSRIVLRFVAITRTVLSDLGSDPACATHQLAYATHHYLVLVASIDSDLLDKIVILAAHGSAMWWPLRLLLRSLPAVRIIIEINGVVVYTSTDVWTLVPHGTRAVTITSISSEASRLSFVCSPPGQCTSASQTRTSRFDIISTSCVALVLEHLLRRSASDSKSPSSKTLCTHR